MQLRSLVSAAPLALAMIFASASPAPAASFALLAPPHVTPDVARGPRIYKLPFPAGVTFTMCQGNNQGSHTGHGRYAWDFCMPIGTPVTASRGGTVKFLRQEFTQAGQGPAFADKNNYVVVDHGDGTSAMYMHVMHNGVRVRIGQHVDPGQLLAYSGNTGWSSGPHTHFMIMQSSPYDWYAQSLPVAFADVPENGGVPRNGDRVTSGNAPLDTSLLLAQCERGAVATASFKPYWVESFKPSAVWSGPDDKAVRFGPAQSWQFFEVIAPQDGPRLQVRVPATGGLGYVPAGDVGPSGSPPAAGNCRSESALD